MPCIVLGSRSCIAAAAVRRPRRSPLLALAAGALLAGCGGGGGNVPGSAQGSIHAAAGSYRGVALGTRLVLLDSRLGAPLATNDTPFLKTSVQPPFLPADNPYDIVYPDVRFTSVAGRVASISVYGRGARSDNGVGLGDSLAHVRSILPRARCVPARTGLDPEQPGCQVRVARRGYEYFSGDPVVLIALSGQPILP